MVSAFSQITSSWHLDALKSNKIVNCQAFFLSDQFFFFPFCWTSCGIEWENIKRWNVFTMKIIKIPNIFLFVYFEKQILPFAEVLQFSIMFWSKLRNAHILMICSSVACFIKYLCSLCSLFYVDLSNEKHTIISRSTWLRIGGILDKDNNT